MTPLNNNYITKNPIPKLLLTLILSHHPTYNYIILITLIITFILKSISLISKINQSSIINEKIQKIQNNNKNYI